MANAGPVYGRGEVRKGRLFIAQSNVLAAELQQLRDGPVEIRIERKVATRSTQANRLYWLYLNLLAEDTGYTSEELHEYFKRKFLAKPISLSTRNGVVLHAGAVGGSTAKLNIPEFSAYLEQVRAVAERLGCVLPDPEFPAPGVVSAPAAFAPLRAAGAPGAGKQRSA